MTPFGLLPFTSNGQSVFKDMQGYRDPTYKVITIAELLKGGTLAPYHKYIYIHTGKKQKARQKHHSQKASKT